jgi:hypothetical protein
MLATPPAEAPTSGTHTRTVERRLRLALGYRVDADGDAGVLVGVPHVGQPPRPLVLIVRHGDCVRFVSLRRVAEVSSDERRVVLWPAGKRS